MLQHHEVQAFDERVGIFEVGVGRQLQNIGHGVTVAGDFVPGVLCGVEWRLAFDCRYRVFCCDVKAFDTVGTLDGPGESVAAEYSRPAIGGGKGMAQPGSNVFNIFDDGNF